MKRIRRTPRGNRCDKSQDSQGILLFVLKRGKIAISRQPLLCITMLKSISEIAPYAPVWQIKDNAITERDG